MIRASQHSQVKCLYPLYSSREFAIWKAVTYTMHRRSRDSVFRLLWVACNTDVISAMVYDRVRMATTVLI
jgi:hypothetical protein